MTARTVRGAARATLAAALITGVAACSRPGATGAGGADSVVVGIATEPESLSPLLGSSRTPATSSSPTSTTCTS
ncbi:hypothetical protein [Streptomyces sp. NBC_01233]|uniref:hypothetical protein n=1 Tax=Streptomyces sp. NBC_01233 TaxID=2903787 RepID=UPI002E10A320|nr:hypothetical protein OG332_37995 [Streptomyces sp. NBC_01233]